MTGQITTNFHISEFKCTCGNCVMPVIHEVNIVALVKHYLQTLREALNAPVRVHSGYRCRDKNTACGGVKYSQHLWGNAADITVEGYTPAEVHAKILELWPRVPGLGLYSSFCHLDNRNLDSRDGRPARW